MYDRRDGTTLYPQIFSIAVQGPRQGETLRLLPVVETNWSTWVRQHPDTGVIAGGTYGRDRYTSYPYGSYRTNDDFLLFGLNPTQGANPNPFATAYGAKDMVLGVRLEGEARAYPFDDMEPQAVINDVLGGVDIVVVWDRNSNIALPFARQVEGQSLTFDIDEDAAWPLGLRDRETGTLWSVEGVALEGPLRGQRLVQVPAHNSFWFAWVTFWQSTDVWQGQEHDGYPRRGARRSPPRVAGQAAEARAHRAATTGCAGSRDGLSCGLRGWIGGAPRSFHRPAESMNLDRPASLAGPVGLR